MIYSESLIRARESIAREIKEINDNMDDDTIVMAIAKNHDESLSSELTDLPKCEESSEQSENMMKRLSVGLLARRSSKKDGEVNSAANSSETSQDTNIPTTQRRIRRVTFSG